MSEIHVGGASQFGDITIGGGGSGGHVVVEPPTTRTRTFRTSDELWEEVKEQAAERDVSVSQFLRDAVTAFTDKPCDGCGACDICGDVQLATEQLDTGDTAAIVGFGSFDETTNPDIQALIERAKELLTVGAVGVSVATDLNPDDLPTNPDDVTEADIASAQQRIRHVAIVDTPAFSRAFLAVQPDGTLSGPMVFEGEITGDIRAIGPVGTFVIDQAELPIPIIFDMGEGDHTGAVIGHIDRFERVTDFALDAAPVTASLPVWEGSSKGYPAYLFSEPEPGPMTVSPPDAQGFRRYSGIIAPTGVCHKGRAGCYTYKGASLDYFHSGARIPLDDGTFTRVGPLMFGSMHADEQNFNYGAALQRTNEDAQTVCAMGRVFAHPKGALFSGVLMPDADVNKIQACAPSVELWPDNRGKLELKTALLVPRPAWPVAASLNGSGVQLTESEPSVVETEHGEWHTRMDAITERLDKMEQAVGEMYAVHLQETLD